MNTESNQYAKHSTPLPHREGQGVGLSEASPVALFVYNRADNTEKTLRALMANTLASQTDLYVFSDGGRDEKSWAAVREVRALLHKVKEEVKRTHTFNSITLVERPENYYLERNIIEGINEVFRHHDTIIVLEDDIVTAPYFLQFMNDAFRVYRNDERVMHVSGFTRLSPNPQVGAPSRPPRGGAYMSSGIQAETQVPPRGDLEGAPPAEKLSPPRGDLEGAPPAEKLAPPRGGREGANPRGVGGGSYFTPFMAGWGWGTWRDRWNGHFLHFDTRGQALQGLSQEMLSSIEYGGVFPCLKDLDRRPIPWDICWSIAIRKAGGLCLYPSQTLVRNIGLTGGTHYGHLPEWTTRLLQHYDYDRPPYEGPIEVSHQEPAVNPAVEAAMQEALTDWGIRYTTLGRLLRRIYYWVKGKR